MTTRARIPQPPAIRFAPFVLDVREGRLLRGAEVVPLRQRALAVLHHLASRPGHLVTKDELLAAVWPGVAVSEIVLAVCVSELRKALGDPPRGPRFVATVHGRGYRFIAPVERDEGGATSATMAHATSPPHGPVVGRRSELALFDHHLERARAGQRQLVFVTGVPGIGKTTLVESFLERAAARHAFWLARGQCVEQHGPGEPFMPMLEGLGRLCRQPPGNQLVPLLREHAPSWLLQLPGLISATDREALHRQHAGVARAAMLREMVVGIEALTMRSPIVVVLEDLHWSDPSTLDLLVALAQQRGAARLLVVGTYRPVEAGTAGHLPDAIRSVVDDSESGVELVLDPLTESATGEYLRERFGGVSLPAGFARAVHERTGGNPLFITHVTSRLVLATESAERHGPPTLAELSMILREIPVSLRRAVDKQLARLEPREQRILEAASCAGVEFTAAEVAAALDEDVEPVDSCCTALARRQLLVRALGSCEWPDGVAMGRYGFMHALYLEVLQDRVAASARRRLHQRIGERLESAYGPSAPEIASGLAAHFTRSGDSTRAARYHRHAGEHAVLRNAFTEAIEHFRAALVALGNAPDPRARALDELHVQVALGAALSQVQGFAAPEVGKAYARALALSEHLGDLPDRFAAVSGLEAFYSIRGELPTGSTLASQLLRLGEESGDSTLLMEGRHAMGCNRLRAADLAAARAHLEQAIALYDRAPRLDAHRLTGHDPKVCCLGHLACVLWLAGYPARAQACAEAALDQANALSHPPTLALALTLAASVHVLRREPRRVDELARRALAVAEEYGLAFWTAIASVQRGWALAELGPGAEAAELLRGGIEGYCGIGAGTNEAAYRALAADGYARIGLVGDALRELDGAFDAMERHGERYFEAELHRLKGELLLRCASRRGAGSSQGRDEAEQCFRRAVDIARRRQTRSLELRAAASLTRLVAGGQRRAEASELLRTASGWFTEGFDAPDLRQAAALLDGIEV